MVGRNRCLRLQTFALRSFLIAETRKNKGFGTSLLLANRPMSPKIINGSFAAIFDNNDVLFEFAKKLSQFRYGENDCPGNYYSSYLSFTCFLLYLLTLSPLLARRTLHRSNTASYPGNAHVRQTAVARLANGLGPAFGHWPRERLPNQRISRKRVWYWRKSRRYGPTNTSNLSELLEFICIYLTLFLPLSFSLSRLLFLFFVCLFIRLLIHLIFNRKQPQLRWRRQSQESNQHSLGDDRNGHKTFGNLIIYQSMFNINHYSLSVDDSLHLPSIYMLLCPFSSSNI